MGLVDNHPHQWPKPFQALEHKAFRALWIAAFLSNIGSWMQRVATAWLVYQLSGSVTWLGIDATTAALPGLILLPYAGLLADRFDRKKLLSCTQSANALLAVTLAVLSWSGSLNVWALLSITFLAGIATAFGAPASQSIVPVAAGDDHIHNAIALNSVQYNVSRAIGPAISGWLMSDFGAGWCFALNSLSFLCMVMALATLGTLPSKQSPATKSSAKLFDQTIFANKPELLWLLAAIILIAFAAAPVVTLLPAVAESTFSGAQAYSVLLASFGVGATLAGLVLIFYPLKKRLKAGILGAVIVLASCQLSLVMTSNWSLALVCTSLAGFAFVGSMIALGSQLLERTPDEYRGRISGWQQLGFRTAQPIGSLIAAWQAEQFGLLAAFVTFSVLLTIGAVFVLLNLHLSS